MTTAVFGSFAPGCRPGHIFSSDLDLEIVGAPGMPHAAVTAGNTAADESPLRREKGQNKVTKSDKAQGVALIGSALRRSQCCTGTVTVRPPPPPRVTRACHLGVLHGRPRAPTASRRCTSGASFLTGLLLLPSQPPPPHTHTHTHHHHHR